MVPVESTNTTPLVSSLPTPEIESNNAAPTSEAIKSEIKPVETDLSEESSKVPEPVTHLQTSSSAHKDEI